MKDDTTDTATQPAEGDTPALPPKLAAALARIEAEGCESSRRVWELATWDCTPDEAHAVVAAWEAKRAKAAELARATETAKETQSATKAEPAQDAAPDFQYLGIPRRLWGPMTAAAYKAEAAAVSAETALAAAEDRLRECREELARAEKEAVAAAEEAGFAVNRAKVARGKVGNATSREDFEACKADAAKVEGSAEEANARARSLAQRADTMKQALQNYTADAERRRDNARRFRDAANVAAKRATENEIPEIQRRIAEADVARRREREAGKNLAARRHLVRVTCRACRWWQPDECNPMLGECHARPPTAKVGCADMPTVSAENWCALAETFPPPSK